MAEKMIISGRGTASVSDAGGLIKLSVLTDHSNAHIKLTEDQARELGESLQAFATVVSSQESDKS
jgi:hypothetical protein